MSKDTLAYENEQSIRTAAPRVHERVLNYQHGELVERLKRELSLSIEEAGELFMDMKRFLLMCGVHAREEKLVPSRKIDEAWHNFILFTPAYSSFCAEMFGEYIHHQPNSYFNPESHEEHFSATLDSARGLFGTLSKNWENMGASCYEPACASRRVTGEELLPA